MPPSHNQTIIVGTGIAGTSAAFAMRDAGYTGTITLIGEEPWPAYYRTRLPEMVSGEVTIDKLLVNEPKKYEEKNIQVLVNQSVHTVDPDRREVQFTDGSRQPFDQLLIATGCRPFVPPLPGAEGRSEIFALRSAQDALRINQFARGRRHAVIVGGGLLGLEAAFHLSRLGLSVEVVETANRLMPRQLDRRSSQLLKDHLERHGFRFLIGAKANRFVADCCGSGGATLELLDGPPCKGDLFVISTGVVPRRELVDPLGLACERGIHIDQNGQTSVAGVFAAGDNVQFENRTWGTWMAARHWGLRAGNAMAGKEQSFALPPELFRLKLTGLDLLSLGETDLEETLHGKDGYYSHILVSDETTGQYHKIVTRQEKVFGAILLGSCPFSRLVEKAVQERRDWTTLVTEIKAAAEKK